MPEKSTTITTSPQQEVSQMGSMLRDLIEAVPEIRSEDAQYSIIQQILNARSTSELDDPWEQRGGLGTYNDQEIIIHNIRRAPSSFQGGPGIRLILDIESEGGERAVVSTSSVSVVVQLLKAYELQAFPLHCTPRISKRQTARGYWPQHLEIHDREAA